MRRQEEGFTLIELVMVIVILGILAAVAIPRYLNLSQASQAAAISAGTSATQSAIAIAAVRHRSTIAAPQGFHVAAELPGATCVGGVITHNGRVSVPLMDNAGVQITNCASVSSIVASVGVGTFSS